MFDLAVGDRAPLIAGAAANRRFYSQDGQAGRPVMLVTLGGLSPLEARTIVEQIAPAAAELERRGVDLTALAPLDNDYAAALFGSEPVVYSKSGLERFGAPGLIVLDRNWRIVHLGGFDNTIDLLALQAALAPRLASDAPRVSTTPAPVLILPNVLAPDRCRALIEHFEASPHRQGVMASIRDGVAGAKLDEDKKRRRDIELPADQPLHAEIVRVLAGRCAPEMKRAFQFEVTSADRILIARYDDTGGYFRRHRDDAAPHTAFREFAVSVNLNTDEYEGGELLFPEFSDDRYSPPAGSAIIFSASLLHEAAAVTRGSRYVALSFLCGAAGQARLAAAASAA